MKKRSEEDEKVRLTSILLKKVFLIIGVIAFLLYIIFGGLYSLLFDLRESKVVLVYVSIIFILLILLILLNMKDMPDNISEKQKLTESYITVGIIILIAIFSVLLVLNLIDFFLPLIVISILLLVGYYVSIYIYKEIILKKNNKDNI